MNENTDYLSVKDAALSAKFTEFLDWYESENHVRLTNSQALRMLIGAGISTMRGDQAARRLQDKQNRGKLRK